ncbi:MAG: hypothetical protein RMY36_023855 [Nostoc sp. SerVER01]|nr:hypothetical protein [Nostoc sp. DedQUE11]
MALAIAWSFLAIISNSTVIIEEGRQKAEGRRFRKKAGSYAVFKGLSFNGSDRQF